jgi:hypothetical protein
MGLMELTAWYASQLATVTTIQGFRAAPMRFRADDFVSAAERAQLNTLPGAAEVRERTVPMHYEVEEVGDGKVQGVVRLVLPEKVARGLVFEELPLLDRPARFTITRGARGNVKANSVEEIQDALDKPFTDDEVRREERRPERGGRGGPDKSPWGRGGGRGGDSRGGSRGGGGVG